MIFIIYNTSDLGDNIAAALDLDPIVNLHTQPFDLIRIMQGRATDGCAANRYRLQHRHRSQLAGPADLPQNAFNLRDARARSILVGDRPAWRFPRKAEFLL